MPDSTGPSIPANFAVHANFAAPRLSKLSQIRCVSQVHLSAGETAEGESDEAFPACIRVPVGILWSCDFGGLQCLGQGYRRIGLRAGWKACITLLTHSQLAQAWHLYAKDLSRQLHSCAPTAQRCNSGRVANLLKEAPHFFIKLIERPAIEQDAEMLHANS